MSYGRIAALRPTTATEESLYVCPAGSEVIAKLFVCNQVTSSRNISIAHCDTSGSSASGEDWLFYSTPLEGHYPIDIPITMGGDEEIRVIVDQADSVSFVLTGFIS